MTVHFLNPKTHKKSYLKGTYFGIQGTVICGYSGALALTFPYHRLLFICFFVLWPVIGNVWRVAPSL